MSSPDPSSKPVRLLGLTPRAWFLLACLVGVTPLVAGLALLLWLVL